MASLPMIKNRLSSFVIRHSSFVRVSAAALLLSSSCLVHADLLSNNPFIPEGWQPPADRSLAPPGPPPAPVALEFKGLDEWNGTHSFYLFDKVKLSGRWVTLNDESVETPVLAFSQSGDSYTVDVRVNGKIEKISLKKPDFKPVEITGISKEAPPPAAAASNGGQVTATGPNGQPIPPPPVRRKVILPGQPPEPGQTAAPIDASNSNNNAVLQIVNGANGQIPPPPAPEKK